MSILKVEVGSPVTLRVDSAEQVEGQYGPQLKFASRDGDVVFVSADTADRQLGRLGLALGDVAGQTLTFEKVQKGNKTYLNINPAKQNGNGTGGGASSRPAATTQPAATAQPRPATRTEAAKSLDLDDNIKEALYADCFEAAKRVVLGEFGPNVDPAVVVSAAATLFIQASRR